MKDFGSYPVDCKHPRARWFTTSTDFTACGICMRILVTPEDYARSDEPEEEPKEKP